MWELFATVFYRRSRYDQAVATLPYHFSSTIHYVSGRVYFLPCRLEQIVRIKTRKEGNHQETRITRRPPCFLCSLKGSHGDCTRLCRNQGDEPHIQCHAALNESRYGVPDIAGEFQVYKHAHPDWNDSLGVAV